MADKEEFAITAHIALGTFFYITFTTIIVLLKHIYIYMFILYNVFIYLCLYFVNSI